MVMTTWTQRGLAVLCSSGLPVLCSTNTHHRRTGRAYYVGTIPCRVTISYPRWYVQTEALYAHDLASLDDWESVFDLVFLGDLGVRGGEVWLVRSGSELLTWTWAVELVIGRHRRGAGAGDG